jgi:hypothetical protein
MVAAALGLCACSETAAQQGSNASNAGSGGSAGIAAGGASGAGGAAGVTAAPQAGSAGSAGAGGVAAPTAGAGDAGSGGGAALAGAGGVGGMGGAGPVGGMAGAAGAPASMACDRACLLAMLQLYLDALVARDHSTLPVSTDLKYTANGVEVALGDELWKTASKLEPGRRMDFADPVAGQVGSQLVIDENGSTPVIYQVRLRVVEQQITEIESMAVRQQGAANGFFSPANMEPEPVFNQAIDPAKRMTREQLTAEVDLYVDYLEGKKDASGVHFDAGCKRYENGFATASGLTSFQLQSWSFEVTRRYLVIDEEAGLVWGMLPFTQSDTSLVVGELFKVIDAKIMMIQAVMANMPAKAWN